LPFGPDDHAETRTWAKLQVAESKPPLPVCESVTVPPGADFALRRTFATEMLNRGVRPETVSRLLGHASTTITEQAYAQLTDHRIRTEVEEALSTGESQGAASKKTAVVLTVSTNSRTNGKLIPPRGKPDDSARDL
jgi:hypothetical protein